MGYETRSSVWWTPHDSNFESTIDSGMCHGELEYQCIPCAMSPEDWLIKVPSGKKEQYRGTRMRYTNMKLQRVLQD